MLRTVFSIRLVFLLCLALHVHKVVGQTRNTQQPSINLDVEKAFRRTKAKEVLKYMNLTVDPCKDFYDFACGNWATYHKAETENETITNQLQLELFVNKDLHKILTVPGRDDTESTRKVKDFYRSCTTVETRSQEHRAFLTNFMRNHGGMPSLRDTNWNANYDWVKVIALLRVNYGLDILIGLDLDMNLNNQRGASICLSEPKTTLLPADLCSSLAKQTMDIRDQGYNNAEKEVSDNMQSWLSWSQAEANRFAGDIVRFELELCKEMRKEHTLQKENEKPAQNEVVKMRGAYAARNKHQVEDDASSYLYENLEQLTLRFGEVIDFKKFMYFTLNKTTNDAVYMRSSSYFNQLARTIRNYSKPTLTNYIMYRALLAFAVPDGNRAEFCVDQILQYFPKHIGEVYNRKMYRSDVKTDVDNLVRAVIRTFGDSLTEDWLDKNDKNVIIQKVQHYQPRFPSYNNLDLTQLQFKHLRYWTNLETAMKFRAMQILDPYYSGEYGHRSDLESTSVDVKLTGDIMTIGWGLLQEPYYHYSYPKSLKYSSVGPRIARELAAAFGDQQWSGGLVVTAPWTEETLEGYRNRSECLRKQYSNYLYNNPDVFQNASKLQELIADNSGLNIAFNSYLNWLLDSPPRAVLLRETLPDLNFSNTQLFFINFAQMHCVSKYDQQPPPEFFPLDKHTPERYHVNGPLANYVEFAREFNCPMGAEMNPDDKCVIY